MTGQSSENELGLHQLLAADLADVAARLLVSTHGPDQTKVVTYRSVRRHLAALYGVPTRGVMATIRDEPNPVNDVATECTLLWEHAMLAVLRGERGDQSARVRLLRRGRAALNSADPYTAVFAAMKDLPR